MSVKGGVPLGYARENDNPRKRFEVKEYLQRTITAAAGITHEDDFEDIQAIRKNQRLMIQGLLRLDKKATVQTLSENLVLPESVIRMRLSEIGVTVPDTGVSDEEAKRIEQIVAILLQKQKSYPIVDLARDMKLSLPETRAAINSKLNMGLVVCHIRTDATSTTKSHKARRLMCAFIPESALCRARELLKRRPASARPVLPSSQPSSTPT